MSAEALAPPRQHNEPEWRPASRPELAVLAIYFAAVVALTDIVNIRLGVELLTLVTVLAAVTISRRVVLFLRDWWFLLVGLIFWNLSGAIAGQSPAAPHLDFMLQTDRLLFAGRDPVVVVQNALAHPGHVLPLDVITGVIYNLHL